MVGLVASIIPDFGSLCFFRVVSFDSKGVHVAFWCGKFKFDRKIAVDPAFLASLHVSDITRLDYSPLANKTLILHGTMDEVVPITKVQSFAEANQINFIPIENADHRFTDSKKMSEAIGDIEPFFDIL